MERSRGTVKRLGCQASVAMCAAGLPACDTFTLGSSPTAWVRKGPIRDASDDTAVPVASLRLGSGSVPVGEASGGRENMHNDLKNRVKLKLETGALRGF